jgi:hypothetical protein
MAPFDTVPPLWDENLWEALLANIEAGSVIPIIGPASYKVTAEGQTMPLPAYVAERLVGRLSLPADAVPPSPTLNEVASAYRRRLGGSRQKLYAAIHSIVQEAHFEPPHVLCRLAEIRHFNLFVTTAFDPLLENAINSVRFGGEPRTQAVTYAWNDVHDLTAGKSDLARPVVYYLLGRVSPTPSFAVSDDDLLEWLTALQSEKRPARLLGELKENHLLIIGGVFSDWVVRIFLRTARLDPFWKGRDVLEVLADDFSRSDPALVAFLRNFSPETQIFEGDADLFVETLWRRWCERYGDAANSAEYADPPPTEMPDGAIFISYAREDLTAVRRLKTALEAAGLSVWFDFDKIGAGDSYDNKIQDNIRRCSLFLPVLSRTTEARAEGFFRREWNWAIDRDKNIYSGVAFITPVAIDDTGEFKRVPLRFNEINITRLPEGQPSAPFIAQLKQRMETRQ